MKPNLFSSIRTVAVGAIAATGLCLSVSGTAAADHHEESATKTDEHAAASKDAEKKAHEEKADKEKAADTHASEAACGTGMCAGKKK